MPADRTTWQTPESVLVEVHENFGPILLDPATSPQNPTRAKTFLTERHDGLSVDWYSAALSSSIRPVRIGCVFVNHPYSRRGNPAWASKIEEEGRKFALGLGDYEWVSLVALVPVATSTDWWHSMHPSGYYFLPRRLAFRDPDTGLEVRGTSFDSAVLVWSWHGLPGEFMGAPLLSTVR
jgi:phage N-6-adenine-methyltransferase